MILCIDIDGTITEPFYYLERANDYFGICLMPEDMRHYDVDLNYGVPRQAYLDFYKFFGERIHYEAASRKGAAFELNRLAEFHEIHYVTAKAPEMFSVSKAWLQLNGFPQGQIHCIGSHYKVEKARELSCDVFVEDRKENAIELSKEGFQVFLMDCPYNQGIFPNVCRVFKWSEITFALENPLFEGRGLRTA